MDAYLLNLNAVGINIHSILFLPSRSLDTRSILWYCIIYSTVLWIVPSLLGKNLTWMHHLHILSVGIQPRNEGKEFIWFPMTCLFWIYFTDHQKLMHLKTYMHKKTHSYLWTGKNSKGNVSAEYLDSLLTAYFIWNMKL